MVKKKYQHEIKLVKIKEIQPNKYNPNVMEDELKTQLEQRMKEEGMLQPILLRNIEPKGEIKYEIVDGEHRYFAAVNADFEEIPAIILDKKLPDAMLATINMNKLKGQFDTLKLAEVIHTLHKTYSIDELEEKLGYSKEQIEGMESLLKYDFDSFDDEGVDLDEGPEDYEFKVMLTAKQNKVVEAAIEATGKEGLPDALVTICIEYLKKYGGKKPVS